MTQAVGAPSVRRQLTITNSRSLNNLRAPPRRAELARRLPAVDGMGFSDDARAKAKASLDALARQAAEAARVEIDRLRADVDERTKALAASLTASRQTETIDALVKDLTQAAAKEAEAAAAHARQQAQKEAETKLAALQAEGVAKVAAVHKEASAKLAALQKDALAKLAAAQTDAQTKLAAVQAEAQKRLKAEAAARAALTTNLEEARRQIQTVQEESQRQIEASERNLPCCPSSKMARLSPCRNGKSQLIGR